MLILKEEDFLEVRLNSLVADYDRETLVNLYQPIIGFKSISLYFTLLTEANNQKINPITSHESIFLRMQINAGDFVDSRQLLEGVGLLKTYVTPLKGNKLYLYEVYAPKTPKLFFDNTLLYGMLMKALGEGEANRLKSLYLVNNNSEGEEITASFVEVFSPDFDDPVFRKALEKTNNITTRQSAKVNSGFSYELFFNSLSEISQIKSESISSQEMKEIERLALLYGVNEVNAANAVAVAYDPYGEKNNRIDFPLLKGRFEEETHYRFLTKGGRARVNGQVSGNNDLAHKINLMEKCSPKDYLMVLQNGSIPSPSDLKLINTLSVKYRLPNSVINAIIDYVLTKNDNVLSAPFAEKVAGSLAREGITTTLDAMNYLKKVSSKGRKGKKVVEEEPIIEQEAIKEENSESLDWDAMLKELEDDNNGEN